MPVPVEASAIEFHVSVMCPDSQHGCLTGPLRSFQCTKTREKDRTTSKDPERFAREKY